METRRDVVGDVTVFVLAGVPRAYEKAVIDLGFERTGNTFVRRFRANSPHIDRAYANFRRDADEMIRQAAGASQPKWEAALLSFLDRVGQLDIAWWLTGSGALAVRGIDVTPRDLDIVVDDSGAVQLGDVLADRLVEPVSSVTGWVCRWWGRAFLHARIEWIGGVDHAVDAHSVTEFGPTAAGRLETVTWNGRVLRVPPLDVQLEMSERRNLKKRAERIGRFVRATSS